MSARAVSTARKPPLGVKLTVDVEEVQAPRGTAWWARVRWWDPVTGRRESVKRAHPSREAAVTWIEQMHSVARTGLDPTQTLGEYVAGLGDRWTRGIDPTSTYDPYAAGLRRRVVPTLGHLPLSLITAGLVDRAIDRWELEYGRSTVKNTVSALVLVLDEAVRDGLLTRNPAKDRARRRAQGLDRAGLATRPGAAGRGDVAASGGRGGRGRQPSGVG